METRIRSYHRKLPRGINSSSNEAVRSSHSGISQRKKEEMEKSVGIVLDLSLTHETDGMRILDRVKDQLVKFIKESMDDVEDSMYFYHPNLTDLMYKNGDRVSAVSNYETDGWIFNVSNALKQAVYVLGAEDKDFTKVIVFITDRIGSVFPLKKAVKVNETNDCGCKFVIIGIGDRYSNEIDGFSK